MKHRALAANALVALLAIVPSGRVGAAALPTNPCAFVSNDDILHVLGWTVESRERKPYDVHAGTGSMCFLASNQGRSS